jgi:hypothetical protein
MKKSGLVLLGLLVFLFGLTNLSWGQCPEDPNDQGECDTLNVICLDCEQSLGSGPWLVRFPMLVTHDMTELIDSLAGFVIPIGWTHTNPAAFCSLSSYWNTTSTLPFYPDFNRSMFRHLVNLADPTDTLYHNRMADIGIDEMGLPTNGDWDTRIVDLSSDDPTHMWMALFPTGSQDQRWWESDRVLITTMTFRVEDTMHVCLDTIFWPPASNLSFIRDDGASYVPRDNLPQCFWIGPPLIRVTSPNGGETWVVSETHDITWESENFYGDNVDIEFTTDGGSSWMPIASNEPNDGVYPWLIPDSTSNQCKVKVSDSEDGDPYDESDDVFSIIYTSYFEIDAQPDTQWVKQGDTTSYQVILTSFFGFSSPCTLTLEGVPPQITYQFDPPTVTPTDSSVLTVMVDSLTPLDAYQLTIIGTEITTKQIADTTQVLLYVISSLNRKPEIEVPGPQTVYAGLQIAFPVIATDPDTVDTLILTKDGVGDFPCYPKTSPVVCYFQWTTVDQDTLNSPYTIMFTVEDGRDSTDTAMVEITVLPYNVPPSGAPGDLTGDSLANVADVVFMLNYFFLNGPPPNPPAAGDVNGDCFIGLSDLIWLINYLYRYGPPPQIRCLPGDFNYDGYVDLLDPPYFIDYMAYLGPAPISMRSTDVNADCFINVVDLVYEIKYLLRGGAAPEPGCVEPKMAPGEEEPPGIAEVGFSKASYDRASRINQMPVFAGFDEPVAGVELIITFDPDEVALLPPTTTYRTEDVGLYYNLQRGELKVGLVDIEGQNYIRPGSGPILNLRFVPADPASFDIGTIQIQKATFVNMRAQEMIQEILK